MQTTEQVERHLTANTNISKKDIVVGNFLGGLAWGVGSVVGVALIGFAIGMALNALGVFTAIGNIFGGLSSTGEQLKQLQQIPQVPSFK